MDQIKIISNQNNIDPRNPTITYVNTLSSKPTYDDSFLARLEKISLEDLVDLKISRFMDQLDCFQLENMFDLILAKVEKPLLLQILRRVGGNQVQAAKILGINRNTLRKKMKQYNL